MEAATGTPVVSGADAGASAGSSAPSLDAIFSGEAPISSLPQTFGEPPEKPQAETPTPAAEAQPAKEEPPSPAEEGAEAQPTEQSEEDQYQEPLPEKLDQLAKSLSKTNPELARQLRSDYFALNGPDGYRALMGTVEEAREYKQIAPTLDDLKTISEFATNYDRADRLYGTDPKAFIELLAEDQDAFKGIAREMARGMESTLRSDPQTYAETAKPFNDNFIGNLSRYVERDGTPEEIELFRAIVQRYVGPMNGNGYGQPQQQQFGMQPPPQQSMEMHRFQQEKQQFEAQRHQSFFNDIRSTTTDTFNAELRKYIDEKMGQGIPEEFRERAATDAAAEIWKFINTHPVIQSNLARIIEGGDYSPEHRQAAINAALNYAKANMQKSANAITAWTKLWRKTQGGTTQSKPTSPAAAQGATKDVGSGSPSVGGPIGAPKGFPPGWNAMKPQQRMDSLEGKVNWDATERNLDREYPSVEQLLMAVCQGYADASKLVLKGNQ